MFDSEVGKHYLCTQVQHVILSEGRCHLGVALGWRDEDFETFDVDKSEQVGRTVEGIQLLRALLDDTGVTYDGDIYEVEDLDLMPRPAQDRVPIWYGGQSEYAVRRAAGLADAWSMSPIETRQEMAKSADLYREALAGRDRSYEDVRKPLRREAYVAEDDETAWEEVGPSLLYEYQDVYRDYDDIGHSFDADDDSEEAIEELRDHATDRFIIGGPETAIEELERYQEDVGIDEVVLRMHFLGLDPAKSRKSMRLVAEEVMPHFQE